MDICEAAGKRRAVRGGPDREVAPGAIRRIPEAGNAALTCPRCVTGSAAGNAAGTGSCSIDRERKAVRSQSIGESEHQGSRSSGSQSTKGAERQGGSPGPERE